MRNAPTQNIPKESPAPLSPEEQQQLARCERTIRHQAQGYVEIGSALTEIQRCRLYRKTSSTYADYCREQLGMSPSVVYQYRTAADVAHELRKCGLSIPPTEAVCRPLAKLDPEAQVSVWRTLTESSSALPLTKQLVTAAVQEYQARHSPEVALAIESLPSLQSTLPGFARVWPIFSDRAGGVVRTLDDTLLALPARVLPPVTTAPLLFVDPTVAFFDLRVTLQHQQQLLDAIAAAPAWTFLLWTDRFPEDAWTVPWPHNCALGIKIRTEEDKYYLWKLVKDMPEFTHHIWLWYAPQEQFQFFPEGPWQRIVLGEWHLPWREPAAAEARWLRDGFASALSCDCPVHIPRALMRYLCLSEFET